MIKEKCSKCCFDLKEENTIDKCEIPCVKDEHCSSELVTCYTLNNI